jgi:hypothetical protein
MVRRDADMRRALLDHLQDRVQNAGHRAEGRRSLLFESLAAVELAKQLVGAVDEVDG